jgi:hypothetical protein
MKKIARFIPAFIIALWALSILFLKNPDVLPYAKMTLIVTSFALLRILIISVRKFQHE